MRLQNFIAKKVHGRLNYDIRFNEEKTFLTGINGSGKTTVINFLIFLLTPDLYELQRIEFSSAKLTFLSDDGVEHFIQAVRDASGNVKLEAKGVKQAFEYQAYDSDAFRRTSRLLEEEAEHFREVQATSMSHPVMEFISSLPTPMFLGLDRRSRIEPRHFRGLGSARISRGRSLTRSGLSSSLEEARLLTEDSARRASIRAARVGDDLQQRMLLNLLTFSEHQFLHISSPTREDRKDIKKAMRDLDDFPYVFSVSPNEIKKRVLPFLKKLDEIASGIPEDYSFNSDNPNDQKIEHALEMLEWSANRNELKRIRALSDYVSNFNGRRQVVMRPVERFIELINSFLKDSGKMLQIGETGDVKIKVRGVSGQMDLEALSSGEAQLFIILANLSFSPSAQKANVFVIDEPELSLHIRWQELFVESMTSANSKIQYIMATHSPSIIMDDVECCVEVKGVKSRR